MNIALILAGGIGQRVGESIPKQFIKVDGKPILTYTLQAFQNNPDVDSIVVVCVDGWSDEVLRCAEEAGITKFKGTIPGGANSMESISNGVLGLDAQESDIVIIHDSVRPLVPQRVISDCVAKCKEYGNGCAAIPLQETIVRTKDGISGNVNIDRSEIMRVQTPQAYRYDDLRSMYMEAKEKGITESIYANTLAMELGRTIYFSEGSAYNIKITTRKDLLMMSIFLKNDVIDMDGPSSS